MECLMLSLGLAPLLVPPLLPIWTLTRYLFSQLLFLMFGVVFIILRIPEMKKNNLYYMIKVTHLPSMMMVGELHWLDRGWPASHGGSRKE